MRQTPLKLEISRTARTLRTSLLVDVQGSALFRRNGSWYPLELHQPDLLTAATPQSFVVKNRRKLAGAFIQHNSGCEGGLCLKKQFCM
jgi:hypothetical protein